MATLWKKPATWTGVDLPFLSDLNLHLQLQRYIGDLESGNQHSHFLWAGQTHFDKQMVSDEE